ncbi:MAG: hypothetical protein JWQ21_633 [Herminiimonas sp.]|nr:hypothetical protein [Herminiimonas sp.]
MTLAMHFTQPSAGNIDTKAPLIYMWEIHTASGTLIGRYVGKADSGQERPMGHYRRNVNKLLKGLPYRNGKPYRRIHHALAEATSAGHAITLQYLCNVDPGENIFEIEMHYIRKYGCLAADGIGLNGRSSMPRPETCKSRQPESKITSDMEDHGSGELEQVRCYVEANHKELRGEKRSRRYSVFVGDKRILRASQSGPKAKVRIKLAVSSLLDRTLREFAWDGTEIQLKHCIDSELHRYRQDR